MKTFYTRLICLVLFSNSFLFSYSQEKTKNDKSYSFNIVVDMNDMSRRNDFNYKFLINKGWDNDENEQTRFFDDKSLYYITFEYKKAFEKGFNHYDRVPKDTVKVKLADSQMDSIFVLTTQLLTIDKNLDVTHRKVPISFYDGEYVSVRLELIEYNTFNEISIGFDQEDIFQKRFYKLLEYLNSIKNN